MEYTIFKPEKDKFYVYEHLLDGEVFYIDLGPNMSPVSNTRSKKYWDRVGDRLTDVRVKVVGSFEDRDEALATAIDYAADIEARGEFELVPTTWMKRSGIAAEAPMNRSYISDEPENDTDYDMFVEEAKEKKQKHSFFSEDEINRYLDLAEEKDWGSDYKGVMRLNSLLAKHDIRLVVRHSTENRETIRRWYAL